MDFYSDEDVSMASTDEEDIFRDMDDIIDNKDEEDSSKLSKDCEVYSEHKSKLLGLGKDHPQPLCEGSGLACVSLPNLTYSLRIPSKFYKQNGNIPAHLSKPQLEAIVYACQAHLDTFTDNREEEVRKGFLLGDGTGTGKTRILAGIIYEYSLAPQNAGLKFIWVTAKRELFASAELELQSLIENVKILTVADLLLDMAPPSDPTVLLLTYKNLRNNEVLLANWMGDNFEGLIILDEAHAAKNVFHPKNASLSGRVVFSLQEKYSMARIVYSSATAASEPHHLLYMSRLNLWGPGTKYPTMNLFQKKLEERGIVALELLAMEMKIRGVFVSRQISFEKVTVEEQTVRLEQRKSFGPVYERCCQMWELIMIYLKNLKEAKQQDLGNEGNVKVTTWLGSPYAASQTFFQSLLLTSKLYLSEQTARSALKKNQSVIIGLQSTGDSQFGNFCGLSCNKGQPYSNAREILRCTLVSLGVSVGCPRIYFNDGTEKKIGQWNEQNDEAAKQCQQKWKVTRDAQDIEVPAAHSSNNQHPPVKRAKLSSYDFTKYPMYSVGYYQIDDLPHSLANFTWSYDQVKRNITSEGLARLFHELSPFLPINPLDEIIDRLQNGSSNGWTRYRVAELTGRSYQYIWDTKRCRWGQVNKGCHGIKEEQDNFMDGRKRVCIVSSAGSIGLNLHSDKSRANQQKRVHITIQYPWNPVELFQQLGRSHRFNQARHPKYVLIKSPVPGEIRFTSTISKRMKQLGAISSGNSRANLLEEKLFEIFSSHLGVIAVNKAVAEMKNNLSNASLMTTLGIATIKGEQSFLFAASKTDAINKTFNRALMMPLELQKIFIATIMKEIETLKSTHPSVVYSPIKEFPATDADVELLRSAELNFDCILYKFRISRTASWNFIKDLEISLRNSGTEYGFYVKRREIMFAVKESDTKIFAYFPYNRVKKDITSRELAQWKLSTDADDNEYKWEDRIDLMNDNPGCAHAAENYGPCKIKKCIFQWGVYDISLLCGKTSEYLEFLERRFLNDKQLRIGKIKFQENKVEKAVVGLVLDVNADTDIERDLNIFEN